MPTEPYIPFIFVLRAGIKLENKEINNKLELTLETHPTKPLEFLWCTFNASPTLPPNPRHGHPALIFDHCTFKKPLKLNSLKFHRKVIFRSCRFERYVDFTETSFFHGVSFEDCSFDEKVYFERATFGINEEIIVNDALAHQQTNLWKSTVPKSTKLWKCEHYLKMVLEPLVRPSLPMSCSLINSSQPQKHTHELQVCTDFHAAVFNDGAEFDYATFHVPACFHKTTWYEATTFLQCRFPFVNDRTSDADVINFSHAQISGSVEFNQSLRPSDRRPPSSHCPETPYRYGEVSEECITANFQYIHVHKQHGLRFHTENLKSCSVLGTNLDFCHFSNVRWPKVKTYYPLSLRSSFAFSKSLLCKITCIGIWRTITTLFLFLPLHVVHIVVSWPVRFLTRCVVAHRPDDKGSHRPQGFLEYCRSCWTLKQYCIWDHEKQNQKQNDELPLNLSSKTAIEIEYEISRWRNQWALLSRAYRDLKTAYEGNKDYIYASDFHYAEKEFRRINYEVPRQIRIQLQLYWLVSGYGERVLRPIWWFIIICILGAVPYYLWGQPVAPSFCGLDINDNLRLLFDYIGRLSTLVGSAVSKVTWGLEFGGVGVVLLAIISIYFSSGGSSLWELIRLLFLFGLLFGVVACGIDMLSPFFDIVSPLDTVSLSGKVCFREALRYSAETMAFLRPSNIDLGEGISWLRVWSWAQALAGPFLFVMFSLALQNKLKR